MRNAVAFVLEPRRKEDKEKLDFSFAVYMHVVSFTFLCTPHLQLKIHPPWQMTAFRISRDNGNGIIASG
jgi:hypothetical protein